MPQLLCPWERTPVPMKQEAGLTQSWSGCCGWNKNHFSVLGFRPHIIQTVAYAKSTVQAVGREGVDTH